MSLVPADVYLGTKYKAALPNAREGSTRRFNNKALDAATGPDLCPHDSRVSNAGRHLASLAVLTRSTFCQLDPGPGHTEQS